MPNELIVLAGMPCSGKTTFAQANFKPPQIASFDLMGGLLGMGECPAEGEDVKMLLDTLVATRARNGGTTVVDYTNLVTDERKRWLGIAERNQLYTQLIAFQVPLWLAKWRNHHRKSPLPDEQLEACHRKAQVMFTKLHAEEVGNKSGQKSAEGFDRLDVVTFNEDVFPDNCAMCGGTLEFLHADYRADDKDRCAAAFVCVNCNLRFPVFQKEGLSLSPYGVMEGCR